jgi:uncharacterized protein (DUF305 family)
MNTRSLATTITALAAAAVLSACGTGAGTAGQAAPSSTAQTGAPSTAQAHNQADVTFVQQMIPHHTQAVDMSKLAADHAGSAQVKDLAARIQAAQQPEIDQMNGFLRTWNASMSASGEPPMTGMGHGDMTDKSGVGGGHQMDTGGMPGMMTAAQMSGLDQARGAAFDTMFLRMMIAHHQGAVTMSGTELREGGSADAKALAQRIIDAQQREITEMQGLAAS